MNLRAIGILLAGCCCLLCLFYGNGRLLTSGYAGINLILNTLFILVGYIIYSHYAYKKIDYETLMLISVLLFVYTSSLIIMWRELNKDRHEINKTLNYSLFAVTYLFIVVILSFSIFKVYKNAKLITSTPYIPPEISAPTTPVTIS
jgi:hypothetical protein